MMTRYTLTTFAYFVALSLGNSVVYSSPFPDTTRSYPFPQPTKGAGNDKFTHGLCVLNAASATVRSTNPRLSYETIPNFGNGIELWGNGDWAASKVNGGAAMCEGGIYFQPNKSRLWQKNLANTLITIDVVPKNLYPKSRGIEYTPYQDDPLMSTALDELKTVSSTETTDPYYAWCQLLACPDFNKDATGWCEHGHCVDECQKGQCLTRDIPLPQEQDPTICAFSQDGTNNGNWPTLLPDAGFSKSDNAFTWSGTTNKKVRSDTHAYCKVLSYVIPLPGPREECKGDDVEIWIEGIMMDYFNRVKIACIDIFNYSLCEMDAEADVCTSCGCVEPGATRNLHPSIPSAAFSGAGAEE